MRKIFRHEFVDPINLDTESIGGKRFYVLPTGEKLKSVTSVLGEKLDKTALMEWKKRVGPEEAARVSAQATRRGTSVHKIAENYLLNKENYVGKEMPTNIDTFNSLKPILDANITSLLGVELALYSRALGTAGRADIAAIYKGTPAILDVKTSLKPKKLEWIESYILQCTVYSLMFERMYKIHTPKIVIIIAVDNEAPQVFELDRADYVDRVLEVFS